jgi:hypothetical protein
MDFFAIFNTASNDETRRLATTVAEETEALDDFVRPTPNYCVIA